MRCLTFKSNYTNCTKSIFPNQNSITPSLRRQNKGLKGKMLILLANYIHLDPWHVLTLGISPYPVHTWKGSYFSYLKKASLCDTMRFSGFSPWLDHFIFHKREVLCQTENTVSRGEILPYDLTTSIHVSISCFSPYRSLVISQIVNVQTRIRCIFHPVNTLHRLLCCPH